MMLPIDYITVGDREVAYKVFGSGKVNVVVELALGATIGEWWHIAQKLSEVYTVLLYERTICSESDKIDKEYSPINIAMELKEILEIIHHEEGIILIGHSQGGLYIQQFCRLYPHIVKGAIFIDPLSANDNKFKTLLTPEEFKKSGVDKIKNLKFMKILAKMKLHFLIKGIMKSGPPFYYYNKFSKEAKEYILNSLTKVSFYETSINEYRLSHLEENIKSLKAKGNFPDIPISLITHSSEYSIKETMKFGNTSKEIAEKVETVWQDLMKEYLVFSSKSKYIEAKNSSHFIHLTEPELIVEALEWINAY